MTSTDDNAEDGPDWRMTLNNDSDIELSCLKMGNDLDLSTRRMWLGIRIGVARRIRWLLYTISLTTFVTFVFLFDQLITPPEDVSKYTCVHVNKSVGCQEHVYHFECAPTMDLIFNDDRLIRHCKARPGQAEGHAHLAHMEAQLPPGPRPNMTHIRTKCRFALPKLVSFYKTPLRAESDGFKVPNLVHYIWFSNRRVFSFVNYLSFVSSDKFLIPARILIHGDVLPSGYWWNKMIQELPNIYFVYRSRPALIQGVGPRWIEHEADIVRLQTIYANGGIYLDTDVLVLRSFDTLRNYELTLGQEAKGHYSNGIIVAQAHSPFICVWLNSYRQYPKGNHEWNTFSIRYPFLLSFILAEHLHLETEYFMKPNMHDAKEKLYGGYFDWSNNYAVHVWHRMNKDDKKNIPMSPDDVLHGRNSISEIINYIVKAKS